MRTLHTLAAALAIASVGVSGASAQGRGNSAPKAGKAPSAVTHGNAGGSGAARGGSQAPKAGGAQASTKSTPGGGHGAGTGKGNAKAASATTTSTGTTAVTPPVAPPNALSMKLSKNPQQLARLTGMLPAGMTIEQATTGFRNQGQFIAALNASKNQGVAFADLQQAMTVDGMSLGQAVKQLRNAPPPSETTAPPAGTTTDGTAAGGTATGTATAGS